MENNMPLKVNMFLIAGQKAIHSQNSKLAINLVNLANKFNLPMIVFVKG